MGKDPGPASAGAGPGSANRAYARQYQRGDDRDPEHIAQRMDSAGRRDLRDGDGRTLAGLAGQDAKQQRVG